jgi:RNA polymerase sigma-70 factor (ECF subfamily)
MNVLCSDLWSGEGLDRKGLSKEEMTMLTTKLCWAAVVMVSTVALGVGVGVLSGAAGGPRDEAAGREKEAPAASVASLPPVVIRTTPQAGDTEVDAVKVKEIRLTFSKKMMDKSWSWSQISADTFPKTTDKPQYDKDQRTCVLPVKLEPGKTYVLWLNSARFGNFKDSEGQSAVPYLLVFQTKPARD